MSSGSRSGVGISHCTLSGIINILADRSNWEGAETVANTAGNYMFKSKHLVR